MEKLRKGLKPGDYFEDGERLFVVDEVVEEGKYKAHQVEEEEINYEEMTVKELKAIAKERGIPSAGTKEELIDRLDGEE